MKAMDIVKDKYNEIIQTEDHRRTFINTLLQLAKNDPTICLIIPDVGFGYVNSDTLPGRYFNTGVTEYTSMVIAAGMALSGLKPWIYSMIPFVTFRVHEQIRNAVALHKANVKILGVLGGPSYKMLGPSHNLLHPMEDVNMMQEMPGMQIYLPKSNDDVANMVTDAYKNDSPCYIRL